MQDLRPIILSHLLPLVAFDGWSDHSLRQAAAKAGLDAFTAKRAFPKGISDCTDYFFAQADEALAHALPEEMLAPYRMPQRIEMLILERLRHFTPNREAVRRVVAYNTLPWNAGRATAALYRSVDGMWRLAGDASVDFSFYTKRLTLAGVYGSTLLFWLNDDSENYVATQEFLQRRLQNVADFGKWKRKWQKTAG